MGDSITEEWSSSTKLLKKDPISIEVSGEGTTQIKRQIQARRC